MKKQIFKLTSILLAMVMVFSLFSIIPISAEGVDMATAVSNLKNAWKALSYIGTDCEEAVPMNYFGGWGKMGDKVSEDDTAPGGTVYTLPLTSAGTTAIYTSETNSLSGQLASNSIGISDVENMYFWYKSDVDVTIGLQYSVTNGVINSDDSATDNKRYSDADILPATNGEWVKFDFLGYMNYRNGLDQNGYPSFSSLQTAWGTATPYLGRINLNNLCVADSANVCFSDFFVGADANIYGLVTDEEWLALVGTTDIKTLKSQYGDAEDSDEWLTFVEAYNVVKDEFYNEVAHEALKKSWIELE
jgi:hypothetical protein